MNHEWDDVYVGERKGMFCYIVGYSCRKKKEEKKKKKNEDDISIQQKHNSASVYCLPSDMASTLPFMRKKEREWMCLWMSCVCMLVRCMCSEEKKSEEQKTSMIMWGAMEGTLNWQEARTNAWMKLVHRRRSFFSFSSFSFWLAIKKKRKEWDCVLLFSLFFVLHECVSIRTTLLNQKIHWQTIALIRNKKKRQRVESKYLCHH